MDLDEDDIPRASAHSSDHAHNSVLAIRPVARIGQGAADDSIPKNEAGDSDSDSDGDSDDDGDPALYSAQERRNIEDSDDRAAYAFAKAKEKKQTLPFSEAKKAAFTQQLLAGRGQDFTRRQLHQVRRFLRPEDVGGDLALLQLLARYHTNKLQLDRWTFDRKTPDKGPNHGRARYNFFKRASPVHDMNEAALHALLLKNAEEEPLTATNQADMQILAPCSFSEGACSEQSNVYAATPALAAEECRRSFDLGNPKKPSECHAADPSTLLRLSQDRLEDLTNTLQALKTEDDSEAVDVKLGLFEPLEAVMDVTQQRIRSKPLAIAWRQVVDGGSGMQTSAELRRGLLRCAQTPDAPCGAMLSEAELQFQERAYLLLTTLYLRLLFAADGDRADRPTWWATLPHWLQTAPEAAHAATPTTFVTATLEAWSTINRAEVDRFLTADEQNSSQSLTKLGSLAVLLSEGIATLGWLHREKITTFIAAFKVEKNEGAEFDALRPTLRKLGEEVDRQRRSLNQRLSAHPEKMGCSDDGDQAICVATTQNACEAHEIAIDKGVCSWNSTTESCETSDRHRTHTLRLREYGDAGNLHAPLVCETRSTRAAGNQEDAAWKDERTKDLLGDDSDSYVGDVNLWHRTLYAKDVDAESPRVATQRAAKLAKLLRQAEKLCPPEAKDRITDILVNLGDYLPTRMQPRPPPHRLKQLTEALQGCRPCVKLDGACAFAAANSPQADVQEDDDETGQCQVFYQVRPGDSHLLRCMEQIEGSPHDPSLASHSVEPALSQRARERLQQSLAHRIAEVNDDAATYLNEQVASNTKTAHLLDLRHQFEGQLAAALKATKNENAKHKVIELRAKVAAVKRAQRIHEAVQGRLERDEERAKRRRPAPEDEAEADEGDEKLQPQEEADVEEKEDEDLTPETGLDVLRPWLDPSLYPAPKKPLSQLPSQIWTHYHDMLKNLEAPLRAFYSAVTAPPDDHSSPSEIEAKFANLLAARAHLPPMGWYTDEPTLQKFTKLYLTPKVTPEKLQEAFSELQATRNSLEWPLRRLAHLYSQNTISPEVVAQSFQDILTRRKELVKVPIAQFSTNFEMQELLKHCLQPNSTAQELLSQFQNLMKERSGRENNARQQREEAEKVELLVEKTTRKRGIPEDKRQYLCDFLEHYYSDETDDELRDHLRILLNPSHAPNDANEDKQTQQQIIAADLLMQHFNHAYLQPTTSPEHLRQIFGRLAQRRGIEFQFRQLAHLYSVPKTGNEVLQSHFAKLLHARQHNSSPGSTRRISSVPELQTLFEHYVQSTKPNAELKALFEHLLEIRRKRITEATRLTSAKSNFDMFMREALVRRSNERNAATEAAAAAANAVLTPFLDAYYADPLSTEKLKLSFDNLLNNSPLKQLPNSVSAPAIYDPKVQDFVAASCRRDMTHKKFIKMMNDKFKQLQRHRKDNPFLLFQVGHLYSSAATNSTVRSAFHRLLRPWTMQEWKTLRNQRFSNSKNLNLLLRQVVASRPDQNDTAGSADDWDFRNREATAHVEDLETLLKERAGHVKEDPEATRKAEGMKLILTLMDKLQFEISPRRMETLIELLDTLAKSFTADPTFSVEKLTLQLDDITTRITDDTEAPRRVDANRDNPHPIVPDAPGPGHDGYETDDDPRYVDES